VSSGEGITRELGLGEVISKTFELYRRDFLKYFVLFVVVEAIIGVVDTFAYSAFPLTTPPAGSTQQQILNWMPGFFGSLVALLAVVGIVALLFYPLIYGGAVKMASNEILSGQTDLGASARFVASKLVWMWALGVVVGIVVVLGLVALIVPGIILAIMFSLVLPVLLIENRGIGGCMSRSRELVGHRWLKTFATFLVLGIILAIAAGIADVIGGVFGPGSTFVSSVLSAFYLPVVPVALTVYYYSNLARISRPQGGQAPTAPSTVVQEEVKFCPSCGAQLTSSAVFCFKCGTKQPI
jgi:ribosomal protein L40E